MANRWDQHPTALGRRWNGKWSEELTEIYDRNAQRRLEEPRSPYPPAVTKWLEDQAGLEVDGDPTITIQLEDLVDPEVLLKARRSRGD